MATEPVVGVLSLQGAVAEHVACFEKIGCTAREVKTEKDMIGLDAIVLPGGESTTMAIIGERMGIFPILREWIQDKRPVWGTCAGMILLSNQALNQAEGGQSLLGGLDVVVCRNYFGSQLQSCEKEIETENAEFQGSRGVFIRAPAILEVGAGVEVLGRVAASAKSVLSSTLSGSVVRPSAESQSAADLQQGGAGSVVVAVRQGSILATAFHPELTDDLRWHRYFVAMIPAE